MALKGTLKDFSIADIFQLISHQQKSGSLYITNENQICHIMFDSGSVVIARFKESNDDLMLGNLFLKAGVIDEAKLQEALDNQQSTLRSIGDILLAMNYITPDTLRKFIKLQIDEVLFRLFQWKDGLYEFVAEEFKYNKKILKVHRSEQLLLDGFRMLDEWPAVIKKVVSLDAFYKASLDPRSIAEKSEAKSEEQNIDSEIDMAFKEFDENETQGEAERDDGASFSGNEKIILNLADGRRSVQDISYLSALGTFETCASIASLIDKNALIKVEASEPSREDTMAAFKSSYVTKKTRLYRLIIDSLVLGLFFAVLPASLLYYSSNVSSDIKTEKGFIVYKDSDPVKTYLEIDRLNKIRFALELYRVNFDAYPENLADVVAEKYLPSMEIIRNVYFKRTGNSYILTI